MLKQDVLEQYWAVRNGMGWFDRSQVGKLAITGEDRFTWLQGMVSNDVKWLSHDRFYGQIRACVLDATGHLLSDMTLVRVSGKSAAKLTIPLKMAEAELVLADLPRENVAKIGAIFDRFIIMEDVEIHDVSDAIACFSLQGYKAYKYWDMGGAEKDDPLNQKFKYVYTMPADYNGDRGFNAYFAAEHTSAMRDIMRQAGIVEVGTEAQEILRVEAGIPKYGADMDETTIALEAGLGPTHISFTKGCYVGQEIIARIDSRGHTNRALTGFIVESGEIPVPGDKIFGTDEAGAERETGRITSVVAESPAMDGSPIALGYARHEHREPGNVLRSRGGSGESRLRVTALPFYAPKNEK